MAFGEQDQAEKILQSDPALLLMKGQVTDESGRTFNNITAFQYAVWALDWHMWKMILKYLPENAAREQAQQFEMGHWVSKHGVHAGPYIQRLLDAQQQYIDNYGGHCDQNRQNWVQQVGGAQLLLPAHVIQEYCRPDRPFSPCPTFTEDTLPRNPSIGLFNGSQWFKVTGDARRPSAPGISRTGGYYYLNLTSDTLMLGYNFAFYRGPYQGAASAHTMSGLGRHSWPVEEENGVPLDRTACATLMKTRLHQRDQLVAQLTVNNQPIEIFKQVSSINNTKEKAREFYHKGKAAFYTGDKSSAVTFFLQAKDSYKDLLTNVELDVHSKQEAEKRITKIKNPEGKYSPKKLIQ